MRRGFWLLVAALVFLLTIGYGVRWVARVIDDAPF